MVKEKDLMIGNYVDIGHTETNYVKVIAIGGSLLCELPNGRAIEHELHLAKPIPLTPDILRMCGFEYYESNNSYEKHGGEGVVIWGRNGVVNVYCGSEEIGIEISTLHHLQNAIHSLTGTELTVNFEQ